MMENGSCLVSSPDQVTSFNGEAEQRSFQPGEMIIDTADDAVYTEDDQLMPQEATDD